MRHSSKIIALVSLFLLVVGLSAATSDTTQTEIAPIVTRQLGAISTAHSLLFPYEYANSVVGDMFTLQSAVGDMDRDGHLDVVLPMLKPVYADDGTVIRAEGEIVVAFGDGTGAFDRILSVYEGDSVGSLILDHFDADTWPDILFLGSIETAEGIHEAAAFILSGDSEGDFLGGWNHWLLPGEPLGFLTGDVSGDGISDILYLYLTQDEGLQAIATWIGDGGGGFTEKNVEIADAGISSIDTCRRLIDLDNDGCLDVIAVGGSALTPTTLWVAYGTPTGHYEYVWATRDDQRLPMALGAGDFNGDGLVDVAIAYPWDVISSLDYYEETGQSSFFSELGRILVLRNDGHRGWIEQVVESGTQALSMVTGDLSEDGIQDLLVLGRNGHVGILNGTNEGLVEAASVYSLPSSQIATEFLGDFNEDGHVDVGVQSTVGTLVIREGDGNGGLQPGWFGPPIDSAVPFGQELDETAVDFNGDGMLDVVFYEDYVGVGVIFGDGTGRFDGAGLLFESPDSDIEDVAVGDFDGDGLDDVAIAVQPHGDIASSEIWLLRGTGGDYFRAAYEPSVTLDIAVRELVPAQVDQNASMDIVVIPVLHRPLVLFGREGSKFDIGPRFAFPYEGLLSVSNPQVGDFNNDGVADVLAQGRLDAVNEFTILWLGNSLGEYTVIDYLPALSLSGIADIDGDGILDFAGFERDEERNWIFLGDGTGVFTQKATDLAGYLIGDLNQDGFVDTAISISTAFIELGSSGGGRESLAQFSCQGHPSEDHVGLGCSGDFNEDGLLDLAFINGTYVSVLVNQLGEAE